MTENIEVFTQNSIRIRTRGLVVYCDPFQMKEEPKDADLILVTHDHYDHFSPEDLKKAACGKTILVVPEKMKGKAEKEAGFIREIQTVKPGESRLVLGLELDTVPAYNIIKPFHPKSAGWVGYVLHTEEGRIYIAGDTDATKEAGSVKCDIALIPIGGTYTMDARKAADLINKIKPATVIPVHYGSIVGSTRDAEVFSSLVKEPVQVEIRIGQQRG